MSVSPDDPSIRTDHEAANLGNIMRVAGSAVVEENRKISQHQQDQRSVEGAEYSARNTDGANEAGVAMDMALEGVGGAWGGLLKVAKDTLSVADDRGWFSDKPSPQSAFPLTDRVNNVSKFFTGASDADEKKYPPKTTGMQGGESIQVSYASRMLNQQKYEQALALSQEYQVQLAMRQRMGLGMGGMAPTLGGGAATLNMMMTPKAPSFDKQTEEATTNWGAGNITG